MLISSRQGGVRGQQHREGRENQRGWDAQDALFISYENQMINMMYITVYFLARFTCAMQRKYYRGQNYLHACS